MAFKKNLYFSGMLFPFKISRSKISLFIECQRCFYLDRRLGISRPSGPGFSLNDAVDKLLKKEFDILRREKRPHDLMRRYGIDAIPFSHPELPIWRDDNRRFTGAQVLHKKTNLIIDGIIDDLWINKKNELLVVDYKSTSTERDISLEDKYKQSYKKQVEIYQWIFRQKGFPVSETAYFVYANASKNNEKFDGILNFKLSIISHQGNSVWVEPTLEEIKICLDSERVPKANPDCEFCYYTTQVNKVKT